MIKLNRQTFVISDLHIWHVNIVKFCGRPYNVSELKNKDYKKALDAYQKTKEDIIMDDVHYWPVTDYTLLKIIK